MLIEEPDMGMLVRGLIVCRASCGGSSMSFLHIVSVFRCVFGPSNANTKVRHVLRSRPVKRRYIFPFDRRKEFLPMGM